MYDPSADRWMSLAPLPEGRHHLMPPPMPAGYMLRRPRSVLIDACSVAWAYDPASIDGPLSPMPEPRLAGAAVSSCNYLRCRRGRRHSRSMRYDPQQIAG